MALHFMSDKELSRVEILRDLAAGRLTVSAASALMGLGCRQVLRLSKAYQEQGATALISKKRGRASNRQTPTAIKDQGSGADQGALRGFWPDAGRREAPRGPRHHRRPRDTAAVDARCRLWADRVKRRGKHAVFRVNNPSGLHGDGMTQFGRALKALSIEIICANSSQAKGRVERANKTLQDRLVKELRLAGVSSMDDGNAFVPGFMADYNARFAKAPFTTRTCIGPCSREISLHLARRADPVAALPARVDSALRVEVTETVRGPKDRMCWPRQRRGS